MRSIINLIEARTPELTGYYKVLKDMIPVLKLWTCGDGCCSEWEEDMIYYPEGSVIYVDAEQVGNDTYEVDDGDEMHYRPNKWVDYIADGYLQLVPKPAHK